MIQRLIDSEGSGSIDLITLIKKLFYHDSEYFHTLSNEIGVGEDVLILLLSIWLSRSLRQLQQVLMIR